MDPYLADGINRKKFKPVSSPIEISGTRFSVQFGMINEKWASGLLRDNRVIATHVYREEDLDNSGFPNKRLIADWVLGIVAIPDLNPQEIMRLIQTLSKQCEKQ
jgi:hypothetical protein